jgi:hypothetical protein
MSLMNVVSSVSPASSPSRNSATPAWRRRLALVRVAAGPLALAAFFLPWASGPGPLAGTEFSGFTMLGFAGRLQALDLSLAAGGVLWLIRLALLGVAIAALWQTLLAPAHRSHFGYPVSGWYLTVAALVAGAIGFARSGFVVPSAGLACLVLAAILFLAASIAARERV